MSSGDYSKCPACGDWMAWGQGVCPTCRSKLTPPSNDFFDSFKEPITKAKKVIEDAGNGFAKMVDDEFINIVNEVIGGDDHLHKQPVDEPYKLPANLRQKLHKKIRDILDPPIDKYKKTLVVNIFAGPGAGKSTTAAGIFFELKNRQINCELAAEYAKDLVWEKRNATFDDQLYLFAKQHHRIFVLLGQVDVVITDCPILLSPVYDAEKRPTFEKLVREEHDKMWTYNVFLKRQKSYTQTGRIHTEAQAHEIDARVLDVLYRNNQCYETFDASPEGKDEIVNKILMLLAYKNEPAPNGCKCCK